MGASFKDLVVWKRSVDLCLIIYAVTSCFPSTEKFGLTSQLRRAAVSIASNIAEGYGRCGTGEYLQFLGHARGSASEVETQLFIAKRLGFGKQEEIEKAERLCAECGRLIGGLLKAIRAKSLRP